MHLVAFDLGGSSGKMFLGTYQDHHLSVEEIHRFEHAALPVNDNLYWDFLHIYQELLTGLKIAISKSADQIRALGIDSFCNDFALFTPDGSLLTQMHSYRDSRTITYQNEIYAVQSPKQLYEINGNQNASFNTLMQLAAMKCSGEGYLLKHTRFLFLPDALIYLLTGKQFTEYTLASVSQMFDFSIRNWSDPILQKYDIPKTLFSPIVAPGTINCHTCDRINEQLGTQGFPIVHVCEHDTASAFLASISEGPHAVISCGTWALIGTETAHPIINEYGFRYNIANEGGFSDKHHRILRNVMGTWLIQEMRADYRNQGYDYSYSDIEHAVRSATPFAYLIDVDEPEFFAPGNMIRKIQSYCEKQYHSHPTTLGEIARCIYESLAFKYRWNLEKLEHLTNIHFERINMLGGGANSTLMCEFTANATQLPVDAGPTDATALGNMITQLIALGEISTIEEGRDILRESINIKNYLPQDHDLWEAKYQDFCKLINAEL